MNLKKLKCVSVAVLFLTVLLCGLFPMRPQAKTKDKRVSRTEVMMYANTAKTLKIADPAGKLKWKSSNSGIASVLGTGGKNNKSAVIISGSRTGTCTITAFTDNKTYKCRVTVKKGNKISRASLVKVRQTSREVVITVKINNNSNHMLKYGQGFWLEKFSGGKWKKIPLNKKNINEFEDVAYYLKPGTGADRVCRISAHSKDGMYVRSQITKGIYRMYVNAQFARKDYNYAVFHIK